MEKLKTAYTTTAAYMQTKLPLDSPTLKALSALDPLLRGHSQGPIQLKRLSGMLSHFLPTGCDVHQEILKYSVDLALPAFKEGDCFLEWWDHVFQREKYQALTALVKSALSIFHGPRVESAFSLMNEVIDSKSGNMNVETCNAIQTVKYNLMARGKSAVEMFKRESVRYGEVDRVLCKNIRTAGTADKRKRQQRLAQREVSHSATTLKAQVVDKEKQARLRHAAKHRKRACEVLVQAKKKKNELFYGC